MQKKGKIGMAIGWYNIIGINKTHRSRQY